jgi:alpha-L-fucosidase
VTVDPSAPGHTYLTGLPDNTLTLKLPNRAPEVDSCVIELFLRD